tara:strand:+ start:79 stop:456 length:378 start_codon:yes stop_codon:yes gene_type:complete
MLTGRPTKYTPELLQKAESYLSDWESLEDMIPSNLALAEYLEIGVRTLYDWRDDKEKVEFSHILGEIKALQERVLINKGLSGLFNSAITKLALGKHGYSDKQETDLKGSLQVEAIERTIIDPSSE